MIDIAGLHRSALDATRTTVAGIEPGHWTASTPNEAWNVRALSTTSCRATCGRPSWPRAAPSTRSTTASTATCSATIPWAPTTHPQLPPRPHSSYRALSTHPAQCLSYGPVPGSVYAGL
jgi:hypothetical protein